MRGDSRWSICPSCARPCRPYQTRTKQTAANRATKVVGYLPNSLCCCSPPKGSCSKVNPVPRWDCACSGRALRSVLCRQSQRCLLCSPAAASSPWGNATCWLWALQTASLQNIHSFSLRFKLFTYRMWVNSRVPSRSKFASFVSTFHWLISKAHQLE